MDYSKLTDAELDERAAKCMGWKKDQGGKNAYWRDAQNIITVSCCNWSPSTQGYQAFRFMEHALAEHGPKAEVWWDMRVLSIVPAGKALWRCWIVDTVKEQSIGAVSPALSRAITEALVAAY